MAQRLPAEGKSITNNGIAFPCSIFRARQKRRSNTALFVTRKRQTVAFEWLAVKDTAAKTKPLISKENAQNRPETIQRKTVLGVFAFRELIGNSAAQRRCPLCPICRNTSRENGRSFLIYSLEFISFYYLLGSYYKVCYNKIYYERLNRNEESKMPNTQS